MLFLGCNYFFRVLESGELCCKGERGCRVESASLIIFVSSIGILIFGHDFRLFDCIRGQR